MQSNPPVSIARDCDAILIPAGTPITLRKGTPVVITQALGGNYTVNVNGNLVQLAACDADALGFEVRGTGPAIAETVPPNGTVDESLLWDQMRTCYDPEIPINIVDLGLVYECKVTPIENGNNRVDVVMTLTAPGCGMGEYLAQDVRAKLAQVPNVSDVCVELTFDPPWNQEMMSEAARLETGMI
ncbi:MAG: putative Fe-S cluster assembly protein SufT [Gammaproteobacteria bacterium]|nr:putative Fe-S cluster assembly protein SufT [Gammaproteobacteria bacterium]